MKIDRNSSPDYLFEVSWEVCNKVGGIHTVLATKARTMVQALGEDKYITIGPDIHRDKNNPEFEEDPNLLKEWRQMVYNDGIRIRIGRWRIVGNPIAVLVDFSSFFAQKDDVLKFLWETYKVDSISGGWDYTEPVLFGYAAGKVIESYIETFCSATDRQLAHFHEWMTVSGGLYLHKNSPYTATVFTTHATVMGRCIAGNGLPLYGNLSAINANDYARQFNVVAKHSLEKIAANNFDCFCTVSDITARECKYLLGTEVGEVTPNGFEDDFVWKGNELIEKREEARAIMKRVAEACLDHKFENEPLIVGTSGRYEFKNKGLDVLIESLKKLADNESGREILVYITVPAGNDGPRKDLAAHLADPASPIDTRLYPFTTHYLSDPGNDPIVKAMGGSKLIQKESRVKVIFVPSYLQGSDGIFNKSYYELLAGMDVTVFASYYEPWGYTPLESVAFSVPTITTTLAGFGLWVADHLKEHNGVDVISRTDTNDGETVADIASAIERYATMSYRDFEAARSGARKASDIALWKHLIMYYWKAYGIALENVVSRTNRIIYEGGGAHNEQVNFVRQQLISNTPTWTRLMVDSKLTKRLQPLEVMSRNLWWSWAFRAYNLYEDIDPDMWQDLGRNPIAFLGKLSSGQLKKLEKDPAFLEKMDSAYSTFREYMAKKDAAQGPRIAYFSMEYGLHSSLKIYSGGLGVLAGDYLKEASDKNVPMVAMGLLYRYGYFTQKISSTGAQEAAYEPQNFDKLPISPARDEDGNWCSVHIGFPGRTVTARIWKCQVGRVDLYLLDTDHDLNLDEDRSITYYLYGGDWENRFRQEMLLGIGGMRALEKLGIKSDVYHCNEGHAAFLGIERINNLMDRKKLSFSEAMEVVRASSLFTTHTPVPAGHDAFTESMIRQYMSHYPDRLGITWEQFINLGKTKPYDPTEKFSMSILASNLSQEINGVSKLHGEISREILGPLWPGYFKDELHIGYVTNGVHFPTWTANSVRKLYLKYFPEGFSEHQYDIPAWQKVNDVPDADLWNEHMALKNRLFKLICRHLNARGQNDLIEPCQIVNMKGAFDPKILTIGFARRFATYKRADLLFTDLDRLSKIVNNPDRPVRFLFAGKAHPNDVPGQNLIKRIVEVAAMREFVGKIIFLPNYDMDIARRMVQGVDVWLNTPIRTLEASGTSGEKCVMNGVLQFSVLDGWWVEGYREGAGWMLPQESTYEDPNSQNELDASVIYRTIEEEIAPMYYDRDESGLPTRWIDTMKKCIADIASNFTTNRMLTDYEEKYYGKLYERSRKLSSKNFTLAREIAAWKRKVSKSWENIKVINVHQFDIDKAPVMVDVKYLIEVEVDVDGLRPEDIGVEMVIANQIEQGHAVHIFSKIELSAVSSEGSIVRYATNLAPTVPGTFDITFRIFPKNPNLPHRMDFALVKWA